VRSSHERWDGTGYPDGLAAETIPLGSRIIAVCDAYDAMTSERPYRATRPMDEALAELRRCAGTQFDPQVVAVFCTVAEGIRDALRTAHADLDPALVRARADAA
jgi:two-component system cell cycle response regulator